MTSTKHRRAFGVVRQSRHNDGSLSPADQERRIREWCEREGLELVELAVELDVSGRRPLAKRPGLSRAVDAIEAGSADVLAVAYFDRMVRSLKVQTEALERIEAAGGKVVALDVGNVSNGTASQWLSSTMLGMVAEYHARSTSERVWSSFVERVELGKPPFAHLPPGLRRRADGTVEPHEREAPIVAEAFELRANGAPIRVVHEHLRANGIDVSYQRVKTMLRSRLVLGELHFGKLENLHAWPAIVDADVWRRAQARIKGGRLPSTPLLLARLELVHCATCGATMSAGGMTQRSGKRFPVYRCQQADCTARAVIAASRLDPLVLAEVERLAEQVHGRASLGDELATLELASERAQDALTRAVRAFDGLGDEIAVREQLDALRASRDAARDEHETLRRTVAPVETFAAEDLAGAEVADQRRAIKIALGRIDVRPGRGSDRVTVWPRGSEPSS